MNKLVISIISIFLLTNIIHAQSTGNEWTTLFEKSNYLSTPRYEGSMDYFRKFAKASPYVKMFSIGKSPQGRDINCVMVSKDKAFTAKRAKAVKKPIVLMINGIHSGEIEGKDACMLLLRDILITKKQEKFLDSAILMVIPIFSVDGHERFGKNNRINQNGPEEMGWRTTAQNLNLNRDWLKADAPEMQALIKLIAEYEPDFTIDSHTTDGADYQYTVSYGIEKFANIYEGTGNYIRNEFIPFMEKRVNEKGYFIAPYVNFKDDEPKSGLVDGPATPRFSTGYAAARNRIGLLIETHMLKPYKERVFATKAVIETVLEMVNANASRLLAMDKEADINSVKNLCEDKTPMPIQFRYTDKYSKFLFRGLKYYYDSSTISGGKKTVYTKEKFEEEIPYYNVVLPGDSIILPYAYLIPAEWQSVTERMKLHGIDVKQTKDNMSLAVTKYKFKDVIFSSAPYEGRQSVNYKYDTFKDTVSIPRGTYYILTNQKTVKLIAHSLEPKSGDSFLKWGFMNATFERKEYFENYVMERIALEMLKDNPKLKEEFEEKLKNDSKFRDSQNARLNFFYERSPYFDRMQNMYPVMRVEEAVRF